MLRGNDLELSRACYKLLHDLIKIKQGQSLLVTTDSIADPVVAEEIAKMGEALGAKVMLAWHSSPKGYGALTVPYLPEPLIACCDKTDVWIELNEQWLLYSPMWNEAVSNGRTSQIMLGGFGTERIARCIGSVDMELQKEFQDHLTKITQNAKEVRITNAAGTDVTFRNKPTRTVCNEIDYSTPGAHFMIGQIGWGPDEETVNGVIAFDGSVSGGGDAEFNKPSEPVKYIVEKGRIKSIEGGKEAEILRNYFASLDDPNMYICAHVCYGCNPGAKLDTCTAENERVWGSTEWGFGYQGGCYGDGVARDAKSHIDGISLDCSIWLDGVQIEDNGKYIEPKLAELAKKIGK